MGGFVDDQDYNNSAQNDHPIGDLNARYRCLLRKPFHDFPPMFKQRLTKDAVDFVKLPELLRKPSAAAFLLQGIVRTLVLPRQFIEGWLVASFSVAIFGYIEFLVLVIFDVGTVLVAPAVPFAVDATRFHVRDNTPLGSWRDVKRRTFKLRHHRPRAMIADA